MSLTKQQVLDHAKQYAAELQMAPITEAVFESWITNKLLKKATAKGRGRGSSPVWTYDDRAIDIVREIIELESRGAVRTSQVRIGLWLLGHEFEFNTLINDLRSEFRRLVRQEQKRRQWKYDHRNRQLSEAAAEKYSMDLPELDPDLAAAGFAMPPQLRVGIMSLAYWGYGNSETVLSIIFGKSFRNIGRRTIVNRIISALPIEIGGALGDPEEIQNCGTDILARVTKEDLAFARERTLEMIEMLKICENISSNFGRWPENLIAKAFRKVANSFLRPEWNISTLALFSISAFNLRTRKISQ